MAFKRCSIGTKGPKVCQEISPTPLHHTHSLNRWDKAGWSMLSCSLTPNSDPYIECRSRHRDSSDQETFFPIFFSSFGDLWWIVILRVLVLIWQERHPVWSSAAGAHLLQGSTCCVFRDGILYTLVVTSGYLSIVSIISNSLSILLWPLTSTRHCCPHTAARWIFSLFRTILCKH